MKINKKIAAGLGAVAGAAVLAGVAFVGIAPANAAAGSVAYCEIDVHKVDVNGNPLAGAEFTYTPGSVAPVMNYPTLDAMRADFQATTDAYNAYDAAVTAWQAGGKIAANYVKDVAPLQLKASQAENAFYNNKTTVSNKFVTDANGNFSYVYYCGGSAGAITWPTLIETAAPTGYQSAGDIFLSDVVNANVTRTPFVNVDSGSSYAWKKATVTVVDQPYLEPVVNPVVDPVGDTKPFISPVVTPVVSNSVVKVAASHK